MSTININVSKADMGLDQVDNTSDLNKPISTATQTALDNKVDKVTGSRLITSAEATLLGNTSGTNTGDQNLQSVTDEGSTTNNNISIEDTVFRTFLAPNSVQISPKTLATYSVLDADGKLQLKTNATSYGVLKATNVTEETTLEFPNKTAGSYTIATTSDLSGKVDGNTAITGATKTKITYDSKGLVTSGADATTADIADSLNKRYVTDANLTVIGNTSGTNTGDQIISDATITTSDITTNNFTTAKHGFVPKGTNVGNYLKDDGTWSTISAGGLTYFTEAQNTTSPNATVNVDSLTAVASTTNADFAVIPKGTGAIIAAIPDGTATGGNKRGANAVDLQTSRIQPTHVASAAYSAVLGGYGNRASSGYSTVIGGYLNSATADAAVATGFSNTASGNYSFVGGSSSSAGASYDFTFGQGCVSTGQYANVCMGAANTVTGGLGSTVFGNGSTITGYQHFAAGGNHRITAYTNSVALGSSTIDNGSAKMTYGSAGYVRGDAQSSKVVLLSRTTTNTPVVMVTSLSWGLTANDYNQFYLSNNNSIRFKGTIIGRQSGSTNTSAWDIDGIIQRGTSAATTTLLISNVNVVQNTPAWGTPTLAANTSLGCLTVSVIGATTTNIQWTCVIDTTEVIYA